MAINHVHGGKTQRIEDGALVELTTGFPWLDQDWFWINTADSPTPVIVIGLTKDGDRLAGVYEGKRIVLVRVDEDTARIELQ